MPITPLPESTARLLGSGVAITSPCDLVKELVDNAIDARATSIEVSISSDSIKQIVVRDDGHGIAPEDLESLGRRSHTSKLRSFDELQTRGGGDTLGFRGEALASANCIASVTITTRTGGDPVASRMTLNSGVGGVKDLTKTSAPVGTTVQVSRLFDKLPVRKHEAIKNGKKSISQVRDLLKAYALARPYLRLSLKVLEDSTGSSSRGAWSYSPNRSPTVHEAVLQIFGKDLASNCVEVFHRLASDRLVPLHVQAPPAISLDALIPKPNRDRIESVRGKGAHISVDGRPVSSTRGFGRKLVKMLKSYLAGAFGSQGSSVPLANPFFRLNISCPPSSYDSNVTPLKDEVIFSDEPRVLECFELMCRETYPGVNANRDRFKSGLTGRQTSRKHLIPTAHNARSPAEKQNGGGDSPIPDPPAPATLDGTSGEPVHGEVPRIRVKSRVNMARTGSNTSLDTVLDQALPAHLPPLSPVREDISPKPKAQSTPKQPVPRYIAESIDRYLQPRRDEDFEIAVDETATIEQVSLSVGRRQ
ncbi:PMS1 protein -like protein 1 [Escovopsis weberi]|uniref:PMS1 protein-like protein 1 n=1 Tax=Escovopsis weberi TaxID=150374 RepID=A0A0M8MXA1_ESCWE|nr:PMS1 protein -like protein 1 [Escovopsis weberi]